MCFSLKCAHIFAIVFCRVQEGSSLFQDIRIQAYRVRRKSKVTAVPVEQDPTIHAEQVTDIINEVTTTEPVLPTGYEQFSSLTTPYSPKAKAKRAPSRSPSVGKPKVIDSEVAVTLSRDEAQAGVTLPIEEATTDAKV